MNKLDATFLGKILRFLSQPYAFNYHGRKLWTMAGLLFVLTFLFNYIFQPFNVYPPEHKINYFWISLVHASVPFFVISILPFCILRFKVKKNWNVLKELFLIVLFLLFVGLLQFFIRDIIYDNANNYSWKYLYEEIKHSFLTGILLVALLFSLKYHRRHKINLFNHDLLSSPSEGLASTIHTDITIETQVKSDIFKLRLASFIFAKADGNYVELYVYEEGLKKVIKRISLKELATILDPYQMIMKTHRSYLVNLLFLKKVEGNAQGYKISLYHFDKKVPVSRKMIQEFNKRVKDVEVLCHSSQKLATETKIDD